MTCLNNTCVRNFFCDGECKDCEYNTVKKKKYTYLRPINLLNLVRDKACQEGLEWYAENSNNGKYTNSYITNRLQEQNCQEGLNWLIKKSYIEEIKPEVRMPKPGELWNFQHFPGVWEHVIILHPLQRDKNPLSFISLNGDQWINRIWEEFNHEDFKYIGIAEDVITVNKVT